MVRSGKRKRKEPGNGKIKLKHAVNVPVLIFVIRSHLKQKRDRSNFYSGIFIGHYQPYTLQLVILRTTELFFVDTLQVRFVELRQRSYAQTFRIGRRS